MELFLGTYSSTGSPGLNFAPWPLSTYEVVNVTFERTEAIGASASGPAPVASSLEPIAVPGDTELVVLTRVDPSCNMRRFYSVALATGLFGQVGVIRQWGRIGSQGQSQTACYQNSDLAEAARQKLLAWKRRRSYVPTSGS